MGFEYYVNNWIYGTLSLSEVCERISVIGFNGVELIGEPSRFKSDEVRRLLESNGLKAISVCGIHPGPNPGDLRLLSHPNPEERVRAIDYVKRCIDLAKGIGARSVLVVPSMVGQTSPMVSKMDDLSRAAESLAEAGEFAGSAGILLTIEPINRYEVCLANSLEDGVNLAKASGSPYVRTMGDTFHMQMEEGDGIPSAISRIGSHWIQHFHVADNTREAPGRGCLPWGDILASLQSIEYEGGISCELLPKGAMPYDVFKGGISPERMDEELKIALETLKRAEEEQFV
jgi:sugar phosphate isomerase/epimerase